MANLALSGCGVPGWHTVYSSGKYEVSHGLSSLLVFGGMRCVACLWGAWYPVAVHIFLRNTLCTLRLGGYCVLSLLLLCGRCEN